MPGAVTSSLPPGGYLVQESDSCCPAPLPACAGAHVCSESAGGRNEEVEETGQKDPVSVWTPGRRLQREC